MQVVECTLHHLTTASFIVYSLLSNLFFSHAQKEHYLGLLIGNDNWWRTHGIGCRLVTVGGDGSGAAAGAGTADQEMEAVVGSGAITTGAGGDGGGQGQTQWGEELVSCLLSYTVIETIHAALFMFLTVGY